MKQPLRAILLHIHLKLSLLFPLPGAKTELIERNVCFWMCECFWMYQCKAYCSDWRPELCSNLHVPRPHKPICREKNKSVFCIEIVLALSSPQFKHTGKIYSPAGILAYLPDCWAHAQSSLCLQDIADLPPAFLLWKSLPCLGCCVLLKIPHQRSNLVSSTVQEPQYIPHEAGMGNSFPPHWTQSCITAPSSTSISPVSPQAWPHQDLPPYWPLHLSSPIQINRGPQSHLLPS